MAKTDKKIIYFHLTMAGLIGGLIVLLFGLSLGATLNNPTLMWCGIGIGFPLIICGAIFYYKK